MGKCKNRNCITVNPIGNTICKSCLVDVIKLLNQDDLYEVFFYTNNLLNERIGGKDADSLVLDKKIEKKLKKLKSSWFEVINLLMQKKI